MASFFSLNTGTDTVGLDDQEPTEATYYANTEWASVQEAEDVDEEGSQEQDADCEPVYEAATGISSGLLWADFPLIGNRPLQQANTYG